MLLKSSEINLNMEKKTIIANFQQFNLGFCSNISVLYCRLQGRLHHKNLRYVDLPHLYSITLCILMDFPIHIDTVCMGLPIVYFKG